MLLKILTKKRVKEILKLLDEQGELYFAQINEHIPVSKSTLSVLLNELVLAGLVERREGNDKQKLPKTYYKLTNLGKSALVLYDIEKKLEGCRRNEKYALQYRIIERDNCGNDKISYSY